MTYTIKDVSSITGLSIFTIRFYDKEGLLPFVSRSKSGNRIFTDTDINLIKTICCLKDTGMPIKDIKRYINYVMEGTSTIDSRKVLFQEHRNAILKKISELTDNLNLIDSKLEIYNSPDAVELISKHIQIVNDEKDSYCLLSQFAKIHEPKE